MSDGPLHFALRELRQEFSRKPVVLSVLGAGFILGLSGPFGTFEQMRAIPRTMYWVFVAFMTFGLGLVVNAIVCRILRRSRIWVQVIASSVCIGCAVAVAVALLNGALFGFWPRSVATMLTFVVQGVAVSFVITSGLALAAPDPKNGAPQDVAPPAILDRVPYDKRGLLVALSVNDHYVDVVTTKGREMVLIRLTDAIKEVGGTSGLQVHRSHWIALDHVQSAVRHKDGARLTMVTGDVIPVSRANMPAIRETGLLPAARS